MNINLTLMKGIWTILLILVLAGCNKNQTTSHITYDKNIKIVALGDSLTYGYGSKKSYPEYLSEISGYTVINAGVNGDKSSDVLLRLHKVVDLKPRLVLLSIGGNDMLRSVNHNDIQRNIENIIKTLKSNNIDVVLIAQPQPSKTALIGYLKDADLFENIAKQHDVLIIGSLFSKLLSNTEYKSDLIHLNDKGYQSFATNLYQALQQKKVLH